MCGSNGTQTHNHLIRKRTLNHFAKQAKWLTCVVSTYLKGIHLNFRYRRAHQNSNSSDSLLLLFDGLWKVKANYMV